MSNPYEAAGQPAQPAVPAGWYPDPAGSGGQRYWDGAAWTEHVHPAAPAAAAPVVAAPAVAAPAAEPVAPVAPVEPVAPVQPVAAAEPPPVAPPVAPPAAPVAPPVAPAYPPVPAAAAATAYAAAPGGYAPAPPLATPVPQPRHVGFADAVRRAFAGWSDYSSRATIAEYWWFVLFEVIVSIVLWILAVVALATSVSTTTNVDGTLSATSTGMSGVGVVLLIVLVLLSLVLFFVGLALTVRRLHDTDKSGWWYLITLIPFGSFVLLVFMILPGTPGPNQYGPVPQ